MTGAVITGGRRQALPAAASRRRCWRNTRTARATATHSRCVYKRLKDRAWEELRKHQPLTLISKADLVAWINSEPPPPYGILGERLAADILEGRPVAPIAAEICAPVRRYSDLSPPQRLSIPDEA